MPAERGRRLKLVRSFVSPCDIQLANKENSVLLVPNPISRSQVITQGPCQRRRRTISTDTTSHRRRSRAPHLQTSHHNVHNMASIPEPELPTQHQIILPHHLSRPIYRPIDSRVITAIDPLLDNIPLNYIQRTLEDIGPQLLQVTGSVTATVPSGQLPREMQIICNDVSTEPPSHVLAAYTYADAPRCGVTLFPAHALVLAANCAHLPDLPQSKPQPSTKSTCAITLPIVPLRLPSPGTFSMLLSYLYTKRSDQLLMGLLPLSIAYEAVSMEQLAKKHAATFTVKALVGYLRAVHGLWSNASALGLFDDKLFRTMDMAWEVLLSALTIRSGAS